jgi:hypothetical protein
MRLSRVPLHWGATPGNNVGEKQFLHAQASAKKSKAPETLRQWHPLMRWRVVAQQLIGQE